ncbi:MAG: flavin reductase family protein [Proteobacteria bacterium]|jgi:flavin reductase (DIM6/NTAB) family NADH-FMN oxidoreductase RutF|nr:flavin reductase family protein [Pseudomonadota bacterium]
MDNQVLQKIGYGVYIICSKKGDRLNGQTANALIQVTAEPKRIAMGLNRQNLTHEFIRESGVFTVSIVAQDAPLNLIGRFGFKSGRDQDKFAGLNYQLAVNGCPYLVDNIVGYLEGKIVGELDAGTHTVFLGEVTEGKILQEAVPMTYAYYHEVKRGTTPKSAPTYVEKK